MSDLKEHPESIQPPFSKPVTEFLQALWAYFKFCIKPKVTDYLGQSVLKPNWYMARRQIDEEVILPSDNGFKIREKSFANIAKANVKLKSLKRNYRWHKKKCGRQLRTDVKTTFMQLFRQK